MRNGPGLSGIELRALVEVVGEESLGDLVVFPTAGFHGEPGLGWSPGGVEEEMGAALAALSFFASRSSALSERVRPGTETLSNRRS